MHAVAELDHELEAAGENTLVVLDCYKTACGSCRYIQPGFVKLCRAIEEEHAPVKFLKHNIFDECVFTSTLVTATCLLYRMLLVR